MRRIWVRRLRSGGYKADWKPGWRAASLFVYDFGLVAYPHTSYSTQRSLASVRNRPALKRPFGSA